VAAHLGADEKSPVKAVILDSAFTSLKDMATVHYSWLKDLTTSKYDTLASAAKFKSPTLVLHSPDDDIVPYAQGKKLFEAVTAPKQFVELHGGHNDGFWESKKEYIQGLSDFIDAHVVASDKKAADDKKTENKKADDKKADDKSKTKEKDNKEKPAVDQSEGKKPRSDKPATEGKKPAKTSPSQPPRA
jgi:hypothetical protein